VLLLFCTFELPCLWVCLVYDFALFVSCEWPGTVPDCSYNGMYPVTDSWSANICDSLLLVDDALEGTGTICSWFRVLCYTLIPTHANLKLLPILWLSLETSFFPKTYYAIYPAGIPIMLKIARSTLHFSVTKLQISEKIMYAR